MDPLRLVDSEPSETIVLMGLPFNVVLFTFMSFEATINM